MERDHEEILDNAGLSSLDYEISSNKKWLYILSYPALIGGVIGFTISAITLVATALDRISIEFWLALVFCVNFAGIIALGYQLFLSPRQMSIYLKSKEESDLEMVHYNQLNIWRRLLFFFFLLLEIALLVVWENCFIEPGFEVINTLERGTSSIPPFFYVCSL